MDSGHQKLLSSRFNFSRGGHCKLKIDFRGVLYGGNLIARAKVPGSPPEPCLGAVGYLYIAKP